MPAQTIPFNGSALALDARPDRLDIRDRMYTPRVLNLPVSYPDAGFIKSQLNKYIKAGMILIRARTVPVPALVWPPSSIICSGCAMQAIKKAAHA